MHDTLVILGAGLHGQHLAGMLDAIDHAYQQIVFLDDRRALLGERLAGHEVVGTVAQIESLTAPGTHFLVGAGNRSMADRAALFARGSAAMQAAQLAHPTSVCSPHAQLGAGTVLFPLAVVNPFARVGANGVIYTGASVEHHCRLDENVWLSPGVHLGGGVAVGRDTFVGVGATLSADVRIGKQCLIGAGAVVIRDVPDATVWAGVPARKLRDNRAW